MGERLPGELHERLRELREEHGYTSRMKLADAIGVDRATYSRIENGTTKTISSDILLKLADLYHVTTDYILGISDVPENTFYDLKELGLSVDAAKNLRSENINSQMVSDLLENDSFATATRIMGRYLTGGMSQVIAQQNEILDFYVDFVDEEQQAGYLPRNKNLGNTKKQMKAKQVPVERLELSKIEGLFMRAIREIYKKHSDEIKEANSKVKQLSSETLHMIKDEMGPLEKLKGLPEEKKLETIVEAFKRAFAVSPTISEEALPGFYTLAEQMGVILMNYGKANDESGKKK